MNTSHSTAASAKALPDQTSTQAAWCFYQNQHVSLEDLAILLVKEAINSAQKHCQDYALMAHDWSRINYAKHKSKQDTDAITHKYKVPSRTLTQWYCWRWQIESFYKLLKSSGHYMEQWQQEVGMAIAKRLMVAGMACVYVWQLYLKTVPQAERFKELLTRLSGR